MLIKMHSNIKIALPPIPIISQPHGIPTTVSPSKNSIILFLLFCEWRYSSELMVIFDELKERKTNKAYQIVNC
jgi:hypothetical protein